MGCHFGGVPAGCPHHTCFSSHTGRAAPTAERGVCGGGFAGCPPQQGASLPRTRCQWPLPRSLEPRNVHLSTPPRKSPGKSSPTNPPASGVSSSPAPPFCHADSRSSYCLRSIPARLWWCQLSEHRGHPTLLQRVSHPDPARTPTSQPTSSPSHLTGFCHLGTDQVKNCQLWTCGTPGGGPEKKLSLLTEFLQQKGAEEKKTSSPSCLMNMVSRAPRLKARASAAPEEIAGRRAAFVGALLRHCLLQLLHCNHWTYVCRGNLPNRNP